MMKYPLNSKFSDRITDFVDYKHSLGHSYEESCRILWKFDLFCCDRFPEKSSFDRDIAMAWLEMRDTETVSWFCGNLPGISAQLVTQLI